jgi:hypothetical protein
VPDPLSVLTIPGLPSPSECVGEAEDLLDSAHRHLPCDALAELLLAVRSLIGQLRRNELPSYPVELLLSRDGVSPAARAYLRPVEWLVRALAAHPAEPVYRARGRAPRRVPRRGGRTPSGCRDARLSCRRSGRRSQATL